MKKRGLCSSCTHLKTCIFSKSPPVWQCEEFSNDNGTPKKFKKAKTDRLFTMK